MCRQRQRNCGDERQSPQICPHTPVPRGPFLRRQESIFNRRQRRVNWRQNRRILADCCRHNTVRFLPTQEWSTCVREIWERILATVWATISAIWQFGDKRQQCRIRPIHSRHPGDHSCVGRNLFLTSDNAASILAAESADSCRLLQAQHCEIPAYAGMVYLCTGDLEADFGDGVGDNFGDSTIWRRAATMPYSPNTLPSTRGPFLRRQESIFNRRQRRVNFGGGIGGFLPIVADTTL